MAIQRWRPVDTCGCVFRVNWAEYRVVEAHPCIVHARIRSPQALFELVHRENQGQNRALWATLLDNDLAESVKVDADTGEFVPAKDDEDGAVRKLRAGVAFSTTFTEQRELVVTLRGLVSAHALQRVQDALSLQTTRRIRVTRG